jgi:hypothetical protein
MEYLSPFEAEWSMQQKSRQMNQLIEQQQIPAIAQDQSTVERWLRRVRSAFSTRRSVPHQWQSTEKQNHLPAA